MDSTLPPYLVFHESYRFIACQIHQTALHPTKILDHVTQEHQDESIFLENLDLLPLEMTHQEIQAWQPLQPLKGLLPPRNGFQCSLCNTIRVSQYSIRRHIYEKHQITGYSAQDSNLLPCLIQTLVGNQYIFLVDDSARVISSNPSSSYLPTRKRSRPESMSVLPGNPEPVSTRSRVKSTSGSHDLAAQVKKNHESLIHSIRNSRIIQSSGSTWEAHSFHGESRYPAFLNGKDSADLEGLFQFNEYQAEFLTIIIYNLLSSGQGRIPQTSRPGLIYLNTFSTSQPTIRPLRPLQNPESLKKYTLIFRAFIIFLINSSRAMARFNYPRSILNLYNPDHVPENLLEDLIRILPEGLLDSYQNPRPPIWNIDLEDSDKDSDDSSMEETLENPGSSIFNPKLVQQASRILLDLAIQLVQVKCINPMETPLHAFLACYSRDYSRDCFKYIGVISQSYSAIIKSYQFLFLEWFYIEIYNDTSSTEIAPWIQDWMTNWFSASSETPLGHVLALRNIALFLIRNDTSLGEVSLVGPDTLKYRQIHVSKSNLTAFLIQSIQALAHQLGNTLFLGFQNFQRFQDLGFSLGVAANYELFSDSTNNFSIIANPKGREASQLLINLVLEPENLGTWFNSIRTSEGHPALELNKSRARQYLKDSSTFLKELLALSHMTSGAPARGTEINQVIWRNSTSTGRNIYLDPGHRQFLIRLAYSKNYTRFGQSSNSIRLLPESISYLVLVYLAVIRPFEEFLVGQLKGDLPGNDFLLFFNMESGQIMSSRTLSTTLKTISNRVLGQKISVSPWRHITQAFIRHGLQVDPLAYFRNEEDDYDLEALGARQMHHSRARGQQNYGRELASFKGVVPDEQAALIEFSQQWHSYLGLAPEQLPLGSLFYPRSSSETLIASINPRVPSQLQMPLARSLVQVQRPRQSGIEPPARNISIGEFHEFLGLRGSEFNSIIKLEDSGTLLDQAQQLRVNYQAP